MPRLSPVLLTLIFAFTSLMNGAYAHPGHSSFGKSTDGEPNLMLWGWVTVIVITSLYGGWRLYRRISERLKGNK